MNRKDFFFDNICLCLVYAVILVVIFFVIPLFLHIFITFWLLACYIRFSSQTIPMHFNQT